MAVHQRTNTPAASASPIASFLQKVFHVNESKRTPTWRDEADTVKQFFLEGAGWTTVRLLVDTHKTGYGLHSTGVFEGRTPKNGEIVLAEYWKRSQPISDLVRLSWSSNDAQRELEACGWKEDLHDEYSALLIRRYVKTDTGFKLQAIDDETSCIEANDLIDVEVYGALCRLQ